MPYLLIREARLTTKQGWRCNAITPPGLWETFGLLSYGCSKHALLGLPVAFWTLGCTNAAGIS